ncbi:thiaminase II [Aeribacillus alveayuensis]|uniref:Aminopyrimidine aminohydrolase n=1 Tax=Aeribacillus alveayuensis TaxID=279215 RepID=A0ABT9VSE9_9BACI|nr:thiaminase/transcriptional activator TenA [Bacillus alveayuensis]
MLFTNRLYEKAKYIWDQYYKHPFVKGIGDGTLDIDKFRFYMEQDYLYLIDYSRLFALGSLKAPDLETMTVFANLLHSTLNDEMELHRQYAERLGIPREKLENTKPAPTTLAYTGYMLNISQRGSLADLIAAVLPCTWSYYEIGLRLNQILGASEHEFYGEWVKMYASEEFGQLAEWLKNLMNKLAEGKTEQELKELEDIFLTTSKFEYMFWEMSYQKQMWPTDKE